MSGEICTDNRFKIIEAYKKMLLERTNIETSPDEMSVIDNILFRFWQMGWLAPLPHGRLVDADKLCKVLKARAADEWNQGAAPFSWSYAYECMADTVDTMPTVIPKAET